MKTTDLPRKHIEEYSPRKTTADMTPQAAASYDKLSRPSAASQAIADGNTETGELQKLRSKPSRGQFGLPVSDNRKTRVKM